MKEKYIQHLINKVIKEAPVDYGDYPERMDPKTQSNIENPEKNLYGKNKAFRGGTSDVEKITSKRFKVIMVWLMIKVDQTRVLILLTQELNTVFKLNN
jgi:hypothetical protein